MKKVKANIPKSDSTAQSVIALFDLDYTLISADCTAHWLKYMLTRSRRRKLLVFGLLPLIKLFSVLNVNLALRNSIYLWAATVGLSRAAQLRLRREAITHLTIRKKVHAYPQAVERLNWHLQQGHKVVIVTGALRWLARDLCRHLAIEYHHLLGSSDRAQFGGRVSQVFCYHDNKVKLLQAHGLLAPQQYRYGYSDSSADIPLLAECDEAFIINPKASCLPAFQAAFGESARILNWPKRDTCKSNH
ncbi:HAD-IB family phosphatase [Alteromonas sp. ASW11-36]|uniref:HAD-IB family phosphatase n=1 Tax=Alteromonas arenosi TaxID=3055817 RepID=A0ABT7SZW5_9ALTE|nr:HAD-IB family phosphatase [Alteromonas sp. ASW11-36]MDM7861732.1 HAD-IB family phosphatase [Alteromonas sp. ASW11-36]